MSVRRRAIRERTSKAYKLKEEHRQMDAFLHKLIALCREKVLAGETNISVQEINDLIPEDKET